jgi:hypothetical protein
MSDTHNMFNYAKEYNTANNVAKNPIFIDRDISMGILKNILGEVKILNTEIQKMDNREKIAMAFCGVIYEAMRGIDISDIHPDISGFYMAYHKERMKKGL